MNGPLGRNERQGFVGSLLATTSKSTRIAESVAIGARDMVYAAGNFWRYADSGILTKYDGFYLSAMLMGAQAALPVGDTVTYKSLNIVKLDEALSATDIKDYIVGGVTVCEVAPKSGAIRCVRFMSTSTTSNLVECEAGAMRTCLYITKDMREFLEGRFIGKRGSTFIIDSIQNTAKTRLDDYTEKQNWLVVDPALGNAWRNFAFSVTGDVFSLQVDATVVVPVNFILGTFNFTVIGAVRAA
jgi:hypothetical protein